MDKVGIRWKAAKEEKKTKEVQRIIYYVTKGVEIRMPTNKFI